MSNKEFSNITKLSDLLRVALVDFDVIKRRTETFEINMSQWVLKRYPHQKDDRCAVCMAGCVMIRTLGTLDTESKHPSDFPEQIQARLYAINNLRVGDVGDAYRNIFGTGDREALETHRKLNRVVAQFHENPRLFMTHIKKLLNDLEQAGL